MRERDVPSDFTARVFARCGLDRYCVAPSAIGDVFVAWRADGVTAVRPAADADAFEIWYGERFGCRAVRAVEDDPISEAARAKLRGEDVDVPIDLSMCSPFERRVLEKAAEIGRGHARPYGWVARELGAPGAMRAVGNALGHNPVPLLIPCHRVIRGDYTPGGYVFGGEVKRDLLEDEGVDFAALERVSREGYRFVGEDGYFCLPTCGVIARNFGKPGVIGLHSVQEAHEHGLVPCETCRPVAA
jgi:methylated-DNA-[protein]-cysteine S-methyltransferase